MTDELSGVEREAMEVHLGEFADPEVNRGVSHGWLAARTYYKTMVEQSSIGEIVDRKRAAEYEAERWKTRAEQLRETLELIDKECPSEEHWHRMGDSMWANIGRLAVRIARAALTTSPQSDHGPGEARDVLGRETTERPDSEAERYLRWVRMAAEEAALLADIRAQEARDV